MGRRLEKCEGLPALFEVVYIFISLLNFPYKNFHIGMFYKVFRIVFHIDLISYAITARH